MRIRTTPLVALLCLVSTLTLHSQNLDNIRVQAATYFGRTNGFTGTRILATTIDNDGFVYIAGECNSISQYPLPVTQGCFQSTPNGVDGFVCKFSPNLSSIVWCTYLGGNYIDAIYDIAITPSHDVVVCGITRSWGSTFPVSVLSDTAYLNRSTTWCSVFVSKLSADGSQLSFSRLLGNMTTISNQLESAFFYGGSEILSLCINSQNEIFCLAPVKVNDYSITQNAYQSVPAGGADVTLTKLSASGAILYATFIGGNNDEYSRCVTTTNGFVYITGRTASGNFPLASGKTPDSGDCFVMKWQDGATPTPVSSYIFGSSGTDDLDGICFDAATGSLLLVGIAGNSSIPYTNTLMTGQFNGGFVASLKDDFSGFNYLTILGINVVPFSVKMKSSREVLVSSAGTCQHFLDKNGILN